MSAPSSALLRTIAATNLVPTLGLLPLQEDTARISDLALNRPNTTMSREAKSQRSAFPIYGDAFWAGSMDNDFEPVPYSRRKGARTAVLPAALNNLTLMLGIGWLIVALIAVVAASLY
ncbi:hypothetical protein [Agrobacterium tumefaciens]|uniref:hypothetical protein n=1 Tax=Agrobacterium tumefaciens TaxID=358 RepID=UPI00287EDBF9|nr:hypothetical protein [Agrobacterium tumefaciens]MDS7595402.1 hypothetical protein [Agrobacterium tumefaciens]